MSDLTQRGPDSALYERAAKAIVKTRKEQPYSAPYQWAAAVIEMLRSEGWMDPNETLTDADIQKLLTEPTGEENRG
jgi:hypothetical protein